MRKTKKYLARVVLLIYAFFSVGPILWVLMNSFKSTADITAYPPKFVNFVPTLNNYVGIFSSSSFLEPFQNSLIVTGGAVLLGMITGLPAAYVLARRRIPFREDIAFTIMSFRFAPELFIVLPLLAIYQTLQLQNTYTGLILAYQLIAFPLVVWMSRTFYAQVPQEIEDAIRVDGGSPFTTFLIITRIAVGGLAATAALAFIFSWNTYALPLVLAGRETEVVTSAILGYIKFANQQWGELSAAVILSIIPGLVFCALMIGRMVEGLTAGAVKG
ncbi:ABC transporter permease (plasmid) [Vibrio nigripulchritudo]|uniref:carbohydrate ABC transporter permease n=1 Tax=Vibrio nigripulchritudo TaxID=28173 RepID=UPI00190B3B9E|nr:carbohydrate ABC transporter permease [Vibrio nigripulchritudo]BCL73654.1 ABC transporter permease [Vibrio nigripulchritudo]BDU35023.1 ABC transporter permease [Vibrio nigripulchritudo]